MIPQYYYIFSGAAIHHALHQSDLLEQCIDTVLSQVPTYDLEPAHCKTPPKSTALLGLQCEETAATFLAGRCFDLTFNCRPPEPFWELSFAMALWYLGDVLLGLLFVCALQPTLSVFGALCLDCLCTEPQLRSFLTKFVFSGD